MVSAPVPDTIEALRVQNSALRTINRCLEEEIALHRKRAQDYYSAISTLESERAANAMLTAELEALGHTARD